MKRIKMLLSTLMLILFLSGAGWVGIRVFAFLSLTSPNFFSKKMVQFFVAIPMGLLSIFFLGLKGYDLVARMSKGFLLSSKEVSPPLRPPRNPPLFPS